MSYDWDLKRHISMVRLHLTAFIDRSLCLITIKREERVLSSVEDELLKCDRFQISVAFITMSGITPLLQTLKELENKNIPGEILTTNYLNFSEPGALKS